MATSETAASYSGHESNVNDEKHPSSNPQGDNHYDPEVAKVLVKIGHEDDDEGKNAIEVESVAYITGWRLAVTMATLDLSTLIAALDLVSILTDHSDLGKGTDISREPWPLPSLLLQMSSKVCHTSGGTAVPVSSSSAAAPLCGARCISTCLLVTPSWLLSPSTSLGALSSPPRLTVSF